MTVGSYGRRFTQRAAKNGLPGRLGNKRKPNRPPPSIRIPGRFAKRLGPRRL